MTAINAQILANARSFLSDRGFNLCEPANLNTLNAQTKSVNQILTHFPDKKSLLFIGNGGDALWKQFSQWRRQLSQPIDHPLDTYTKNTLEHLQERIFSNVCGSTLIFPFYQEKIWFNFQNLAESLNITRPSPLGLHLHPKFGPWVSFRGLVLLEEAWADDVSRNEIEAFNPCPACEKFCIKQCPAKALSETGADLTTCYSFRLAPQSVCENRCLARLACPIGKEHAFPEEAIAFHYRLSK